MEINGIEILKNLITIDTTVPPGRNYEQALDYLAPFFKQCNFEVLKITIPPAHAENRSDRMALICHCRVTNKPRLIFYTHVDVVPAEGWDAFNPRLEDGKLFGRGAADMKGSIAALLIALFAVRQRHLNFDTSVMVTVDEEYSQASQLRYLTQYLQPVDGAYVFSLDSSYGFVSIAGLGLLQMDIEIKGKSVHSGLAHLGENAIEKAIPVLQALMELKQKVIKRKSAVRAAPDTGLEYMVPRLNINVIQGGLKTNIIPDTCLISIDRRLVPEENIEDAEKEILTALESASQVKWEIKKIFKIPSFPPCDDDITDRLASIIHQVTGNTGKYGEMGSGDLSAVVNMDWHGKDFGTGVIRTECNIHGKNEFVYLDDIKRLAEIIKIFLTD